jgi:hypothetical protein
VSGGDPPQQEAVEKLLRSHGYSVADYSNAQVSVDLAKMEIGYLGGTHKVNLRKEAMQRQMECWL